MSPLSTAPIVAYGSSHRRYKYRRVYTSCSFNILKGLLVAAGGGAVVVAVTVVVVVVVVSVAGDWVAFQSSRALKTILSASSRYLYCESKSHEQEKCLGYFCNQEVNNILTDATNSLISSQSSVKYTLQWAITMFHIDSYLHFDMTFLRI
ncbi:Hypothetical predicted protein [Octopus vulgaris]|uniref:Uncharacterized protein n=1 Tax=Octopus vulgaris TaxID=6645 RepID=A0AA36EZP3_OCTVU|nr:Hypothetical predicted protein [Octopus vulgaris]